MEREWRRKEKEAGLKRLTDQKILKKDRMEQINNKRIIQALEIERDKLEFEKIVCEQQAALSKEKKELERKRQQALVLRGDILKQVCIINPHVRLRKSYIRTCFRVHYVYFCAGLACR